MISKLHYITPNITDQPLFDLVERVCAAGVDWVQLRLKDKDDAEVLENAMEVRDICDSYDINLILNDYAHLVTECEADGLHVGKNDMPLTEARKLLGPDIIIGATANTIADVQQHTIDGADYIGLGPIHYTTTKKVLSPILEDKDIDQIMALVDTPPIIAIGGIVPADVERLIGKGFHGVAVSSAISEAESINSICHYFIKKLDNETIKNS